MPEQHKEAASKRAKALAALAVEREGYVRAGNKDRVAEVDNSIAALGGKDARKAGPVGRTSERKSTT